MTQIESIFAIVSFRLFDEAASVAAGASFGASAAAAAADVEELLERVDREKKLVDGVAMLASLGIQNHGLLEQWTDAIGGTHNSHAS